MFEKSLKKSERLLNVERRKHKKARENLRKTQARGVKKAQAWAYCYQFYLCGFLIPSIDVIYKLLQ